MANVTPGDEAPKGVAPTGPASPSRAETPAGAPRIARLKQRRDFLRVAGRQCKAVTPGLILQAAPMPAPRDGAESAGDEPRPDVRIGFTVSKKVGNAVKRNRARRRLRAAVDAVMADRALPGTDYVVIGRAATVDRPFDALLNDLRSAVQRVGTSLKGGPPTKKARDR